MNKSTLHNNLVNVKALDVVRVNSKGEKTISDKNKYIACLLSKAFSLKDIGCNFVVNTEFNNKTFVYSCNTTSKFATFEKTSFSITKETLLKWVELFNVVSTTCIIQLYKNDKEQLILKKSDIKYQDKNYFVHDDTTNTTEIINAENSITGEVEEIQTNTRKHQRLINDDEKQQIVNYFVEISQIVPLSFINEIESEDEIKCEFIA